MTPWNAKPYPSERNGSAGGLLVEPLLPRDRGSSQVGPPTRLICVRSSTRYGAATIISTSDVDRIGLRCHGRQMKHATVVPVIRSKDEALAPLFNEHQAAGFGLPAKCVLGYGGIALCELPDWIAIPSPLGCGNWTTPRQRRIPSTVSAGPVCGTQIVCGKSTRGCWLLPGPTDRSLSPGGDPQSPLRWTCKSTRNLANELTRQGHPISPRTVAALLHEGRLQLCRPTAPPPPPQKKDDTRGRRSPGSTTPSSATSTIRSLLWQRQQQPAISVDCKKEGESGRFLKNAGGEWRPTGQPAEVRGHDFKIR